VARYQRVWTTMRERESSYVSVSVKEETGETRVMLGVFDDAHGRIMSLLSRLIANYSFASRRKYVEPFRNGVHVHSLYFDAIDQAAADEFVRDLNIALVLPENAVADLFFRGVLSSRAALYAASAAAFTHHFISMLTDEYVALQHALKDQPEARGIVDSLKQRLIKDTYSTTRISNTVVANAGIVEKLYEHFASRCGTEARPERREGGKRGKAAKAPSHAELETELRQTIAREIGYSKDRAILEFFLTFNDAVVRTNFFAREKNCAAYRLDPAFLNRVDYPEALYGLFFLVGREFVGFHARFRDIARGGIRIVRSPSREAYSHNIDTIFAENYNLALTQQRKNKDIPEGGSKGTILLNVDRQDAGERAFKNYVDGLLDLLVEPDSKPPRAVELLFLGPDEGSAPFMDWAAERARRRGYPFWKSFSTGKSPELGGIPHDLYGMTTLGVREYAIGALAKLSLSEESVSKVQTGGPDGDLGSNEILYSRDRTIAVVDGSGVLYDPNGINRSELTRLARLREPVGRFDTSLLSPRGFLILVSDRNRTLPDGTLVANGEEFRNAFHLGPYARGDIFVPCGGRPGAVNINNWRAFLDESGKPKFAAIVEGANLFITEDARLRLEEHGVIVLKDASTNKGGVTSSSLEVLASLALSDDEWDEHMRVRSGAVPPFRREYVEAIVRTIKENAGAEFDLLWREREKSGTPLATLSNQVSERINRLTDAIRESELSARPEFRARVLARYVPGPLLSMVGIEDILARVPEAYLRAMTATELATGFIYRNGLSANEVDFADYLAHV